MACIPIVCDLYCTSSSVKIDSSCTKFETVLGAKPSQMSVLRSGVSFGPWSIFDVICLGWKILLHQAISLFIITVSCSFPLLFSLALFAAVLSNPKTSTYCRGCHWRWWWSCQEDYQEEETAFVAFPPPQLPIWWTALPRTK